MSLLKKIIKTILWLMVIVFVIKQMIFRFKHPEMTETELFINMFQIDGE